MRTDIEYLSVTQLTDLYGAGNLSPVGATEAALAAIAACDGVLNAFRLVDGEAALDAARRSERRWRAQSPLSPLDGVPVSIKDLLLTQGWPTLRGSKLIDPDQPWEEDAPAVARMRAAGAVLLGKTNTAEFGWKGVTDSPLAGITRNPWNAELTPGGFHGRRRVMALSKPSSRMARTFRFKLPRCKMAVGGVSISIRNGTGAVTATASRSTLVR